MFDVKMEHEFGIILERFRSVGTCFLLSIVYLASLHVWNSPYTRDHPETIKRRFTSVFLMLFVAPGFLYLGLNKEILKQFSFSEVLGFRKEGLLPAIMIPLVLTMILFLGPISMEMYKILKGTKVSAQWRSKVTNLIWLRNHLVAPFSEEFTYRCCMLPLLLQCLKPSAAIVINPVLFGIAHFHHMKEQIKFGMDFVTALKISCFQFIYTTMFGAYSAYLLYRTGHFMSVFVVHAFCNHMGFPDVIELAKYNGQKKIIFCGLFILGFIVWCLLINPLTEPAWYSNKFLWHKI